ncbi:MAG: nucleotidyltransferase domain-containing protein [Bacteroidales bacterium]|nr:nucleotidyltransferase domain-containing protein [Bacteroidales bacterium]
MSQKDIIQGMKELASAVLPSGAEALLFGSRARGDARPDSDWDILILINGDIYSFSDWDRRSNTPFYKNVQSEGISLCR